MIFLGGEHINHWKKTILIVVILALNTVMAGLPVFAAGRLATPANVKVKIGSHTNSHVIEKVGYQIDGKNYFMIDDFAQYVTYDRTWEVVGAESTAKRKDGEMVLILGQGNKEAIPVERTFRVTQNRQDDSSKLAQMQGYAIAGHEYYAVRDIAKLLEYSCGWDKENRCVEMVYNRAYEDRGAEVAIPADIEERIEEKLNAVDAERSVVIEGNDMVYIAGSGVYENMIDYLEEHAPENMHNDYAAGPYIIEETKVAEGIPIHEGEGYQDSGFPPETELRLYYKIAGYPADFAYRIWVFGGAVKVIVQEGEWNPNIGNTIKYKPKYRESELIEMAKELDNPEGTKALTLHDATVYTYFNMEDLKFKYHVTMFYESDAYYIRGISHEFED